MSYIDAIHDKARDVIHVVEKSNGSRLYETYPIMWEAYYEDPQGTYTTIYGTKASKISARSKQKFNAEIKSIGKNVRLFEHDTNPIFDVLSKHYSGQDLPDLNIGFFDIEVDFDPERGFSTPDDPFSAVTAISLYISEMQKNITLVMPPPTISWEEAQKIVERFDDTFLFDNEADLLKTFLELIDTVDVLSGWHSEGFDIPYLVNRIVMILGGDYTRKMCLWDMKPRPREYEMFGKKQMTYDLVGRLHLDYLQLYRKYTYHEMHSYSLDAIGEYEIQERKIPYEGSLDNLYKNDFYKFIEYNRQDTFLLVKIDRKLQFIDIANVVAHDNSVLFQTTMGAVAVTDQAIINESHRLGLVVPSRKPRTFGEKDDSIDLRTAYDAETATRAVGAYVANPKKGIHDWVGAIDINSLYPSVIRSLNMSPETVVGQVRLEYTNDLIRKRLQSQKGKTPSITKAWDGIFSTLEFSMIQEKDKINLLTLNMEDGSTIHGTGAELNDLIYNKNNGRWAITSNGTIFRQDKPGVIPGLLGRWYAERQQRQLHTSKFTAIIDGKVPCTHSIAPALGSSQMTSVYRFSFDELDKIMSGGNDTEISNFFHKWHLKEIDGFVLPINMDIWKGAEEYWDKQQLVRKIGLNSLYGALLNKGSRFNDVRIGQSTTLTGRCITRHMASKTNEIFTGEYDHEGKTIIYGDTDSVYFSAWPIIKDTVESGEIEWSTEKAIEFYDIIAEEVNDSFSEYMCQTFGVSHENGRIIQAGREIVASRAIFVTKKRYATLIVDKEGTRCDVDGKPGKIKVTGLEIKRSDTPQDVQEFLEKLITGVLTGMSESDAIAFIREFKLQYAEKHPWEKGTPKRVNNLTNHTKKFKKTGKCSIGHAMAAINWNQLREMHSDKYSMEIQDGAKTIVCKLKSNALGMTSVSYPIDQLHIPKWFQELPFDEPLMEETVVNKKVYNLLGELGWDLSAADTTTTAHDLFFFD